MQGAELGRILVSRGVPPPPWSIGIIELAGKSRGELLASMGCGQDLVE